MMRRVLTLVAVCGAILIGSASAQQGEPIKIGALFDLSGPTSEVGRPYAEGVTAFVSALNNSGGINGRPVELISADYESDVQAAERLYAQFLNQGVVAVLGWGDSDARVLVERTAVDRIPLFTAAYSAALNDPNGTAPYSFLVGVTYDDQMQAMMTYMLSHWTSEGNSPADMRIVLFLNDSPFGYDPLSQGERFARNAGIGGVLAIPMPRGATDFTAELQQADDFGVTHIIVQNLPGPAATLARNAFDFFGGPGWVHFGCLNWCANEIFVDRAGPAAENALGAMPFTPTSVDVPGQDAPRRFLASRGQDLEDASLHFTQGWATMDVVTEAIRATLDAGLDLTGPNLRAILETFEGYETGGLLAPVSFSAEDHRANRALKIYQVQNGTWVESSRLIDLNELSR